MTVGFVARVDLVMNLGAVSETITVSGASPLVDTTIDRHTDRADPRTAGCPPDHPGRPQGLPGPGARRAHESRSRHVRSDRRGGVQGLRAAGRTVAHDRRGAGLRHAPAAPISTSTRSTGRASRASAATRKCRRRGMLVDSMIKSGGNEFHGDANVYGTNRTFEANNVDDELRSQGIQRRAEASPSADLSGSIGGRIIRNKLWFFGAASTKWYDREVLDAFDERRHPIVLTTDMYYHVEKISYQMTPANRFTGFLPQGPGQPGTGREPIRSGGIAHQWRTTRSTSGERSNGRACAAIRWSRRCSTASSTTPRSMTAWTREKVATTDIATLYVTGDHVLTMAREIVNSGITPKPS